MFHSDEQQASQNKHVHIQPLIAALSYKSISSHYSLRFLRLPFLTPIFFHNLHPIHLQTPLLYYIALYYSELGVFLYAPFFSCQISSHCIFIHQAEEGKVEAFLCTQRPRVCVYRPTPGAASAPPCTTAAWRGAHFPRAMHFSKCFINIDYFSPPNHLMRMRKQMRKLKPRHRRFAGKHANT